jgi:hypothetical protein
MRFLMMVMGNSDYEAGKPPSPALMEAIEKLSKQETATGALLQSEGLMPSAYGARVRVARGKVSVTDGPFAEAKEIVGGFAILRAASLEEAKAMGARFMQLHADVLGDGFEGELVVRQIAEFPEG